MRNQRISWGSGKISKGTIGVLFTITLALALAFIVVSYSRAKGRASEITDGVAWGTEAPYIEYIDPYCQIIKNRQRFLKEAGYYKGKIDGIRGPVMIDAYERWATDFTARPYNEKDIIKLVDR